MVCDHRHGSFANVGTPCDGCTSTRTRTRDDPREKEKKKESSCRKSTRSESAGGKANESTDKCQALFREAIHGYEGRQHELDDRERVLREKVAIMERSMPALVAMSMWRASGAEAADVNADATGALARVRCLMRKLSPLPDPADELVGRLGEQVERLDLETAELHDKIISADVELEEGCMELESLELANRELGEQLECMESGIESGAAGLEPISSDDRLCLAKIRALGEEEARIKRHIEVLETREVALRAQIERILGNGEDAERWGSQSRRHHAHWPRSRRKRDRSQNLDKISDDVRERFVACQDEKTRCDALDEMARRKSSTKTCKCRKRAKTSHRKTDASFEFAFQKSNHQNKHSDDASLGSPWHTSDPKTRHLSSSSETAPEADRPLSRRRDKPDNTSHPPCAVIVVKACECERERGQSHDEAKRDALDEIVGCGDDIVVDNVDDNNNDDDRNDKNHRGEATQEGSWDVGLPENPWCAAGAGNECRCSSSSGPVDSIAISTDHFVYVEESRTVMKQKNKVE